MAQSRKRRKKAAEPRYRLSEGVLNALRTGMLGCAINGRVQAGTLDEGLAQLRAMAVPPLLAVVELRDRTYVVPWKRGLADFIWRTFQTEAPGIQFDEGLYMGSRGMVLATLRELTANFPKLLGSPHQTEIYVR